MVLNYYSPSRYPLTEESERKLFEKIKFSKYAEYGGCYTKLAWFALNRGFNVNFIIGGIPHNIGLPAEVYGTLIDEWIRYFNKSLKKKKFKLIQLGNSANNAKMLSKLLEEYKAPIIFYSHANRHNGVFIGSDSRYYYILDPIKGKFKEGERAFSRRIQTPWGVNALQVYKENEILKTTNQKK